MFKKITMFFVCFCTAISLTALPNVAVSEGHMTQEQMAQFNDRLKTYGPIYVMAEVGLNAGHSAENFFQNCPYLTKFVSFDICYHHYVNVLADYFSKLYPGIFEFVRGDSLVSIPKYVQENPEVKFDLVYIDGGHSYFCCYNDIVNFKNSVKAETILWVDDYNFDGVKHAVNDAVKNGIIAIDGVYFTPQNGRREWVEAHYIVQ